MKTKWTKGSWQVSGVGLVFRADLDGRTLIAEAKPLDYAGDDQTEQRANARLIAAAPALAEALRGLVEFHDKAVPLSDAPAHIATFDGRMAAARAALMRALVAERDAARAERDVFILRDAKIASQAAEIIGPTLTAEIEARGFAAGAEAMRVDAVRRARCAFDDRPRLPESLEWHDGYDAGTAAASDAVSCAPLPEPPQ